MKGGDQWSAILNARTRESLYWAEFCASKVRGRDRQRMMTSTSERKVSTMLPRVNVASTNAL